MTARHLNRRCVFALVGALLLCGLTVHATPANRAALEKHYEKFLAKNLARCTTCHLPSEHKNPESLDEFPHNPFGVRLREAGRRMGADESKKDLPARLKLIAREDADGDGIENETELLLGHNPGDAMDAPTYAELADGVAKRAEFAAFLASYRWQPFEPVVRPGVPVISNSVISKSVSQSNHAARTVSLMTDSLITFPLRNPIDSFVAAEHQARGLKPRPEAPKEILLRRVYLDLIGLSPTPEELGAFEKDESADAYERIVDRLLADPRHGERWARHWMDVWRYSDWAGWSGGNQIRDSQPHIWKWRDWIVESLNTDKGYDRMLVEMLAADELAPEDTNALRATGFLVRNYKMLSREQWLEDTVKHTSLAFLGVTVGCAKCHDHMTDPISQAEYYSMRAIFEPHWVRTDPVPGDTNTLNAGLARVFDTDTNPPTYFLTRGDERKADTNRVMSPDVPRAFGGRLDVRTVSLPLSAGRPNRQEFVYRDALAAADYFLTEARAKFTSATRNQTNATRLAELELLLSVSEARREALAALIEAEKFEDAGRRGAEEWTAAATNAVARQREVTVAEARLKLHQARAAETEAGKKSGGKTNAALAELKKKTTEAEKTLAGAVTKWNAGPDTNFKARTSEKFPTTSTGRRLAFARWVASTNNPLTARVAANQIWLRHFGQALVPAPQDFGRASRGPSHPQLLDWLAAELMREGVKGSRVEELKSSNGARADSSTLQLFNPSTPWSMKHLHRLIVTSSTYRMASTPDEADAKIDPDNTFLWRMNSRRMEAEVVRDNLLFVSGSLDLARGGPEIDHTLGLKSKRRSLYFRQAAEKEMEFLKIFDGPAVTECYVRRPTVVPQQALALGNSELTQHEARALVKKISSAKDDEAFVRRAYESILARHPKAEELKLCREFLEARAQSSSAARAREALVLVLFNHNEFVTVR